MSKKITLQKYCVECGRVSGRLSFGGTYAFHFWCWLRWLWRGLTRRTPDFGDSRPNDCEINPEDLSGKYADDTPTQSR